MKYPSIALLFLALIGCSADQRAVKSKCIVYKDKAEFIFPIADVGIYRWGKLLTLPNFIEYECMAEIGDYNIGFSKFKFESKTNTGTLGELLSAGQCNVWESGTYVQGINLEIKYSEQRLVITIEDEKFISELIEDMPGNYKIRIKGFKYIGTDDGEFDYKADSSANSPPIISS